MKIGPGGVLPHATCGTVVRVRGKILATQQRYTYEVKSDKIKIIPLERSHTTLNKTNRERETEIVKSNTTKQNKR